MPSLYRNDAVEGPEQWPPGAWVPSSWLFLDTDEGHLEPRSRADYTSELPGLIPERLIWDS